MNHQQEWLNNYWLWFDWNHQPDPKLGNFLEEGIEILWDRAQSSGFDRLFKKNTYVNPLKSLLHKLSFWNWEFYVGVFINVPKKSAFPS